MVTAAPILNLNVRELAPDWQGRRGALPRNDLRGHRAFRCGGSRSTTRCRVGLTIPPNVQVCGRLPLAEAENISTYANARFTVLSPVHDQVPCSQVTTSTAMPRGKALVTTDSEGLHDYVRDGESGLLCPSGDAQTLADAIRRLWQQSEPADCLGRASQTYAHTHCTVTALVRWFEGWLAELSARP
ncbi:MAG: glycosyltransferase [Proteobacteria bacterium]|nr:glycosyltransferase [Pseudomonadota bacterium]